jgi:hypothetical protein
MTWRLAAISTVLSMAVPLVHAQTEPPAPRDIDLTPPAARAKPQPEPTVSLERIQKKLAEQPASAATNALKLEYYIEVYGKAPQVNFLENFNVTSGPVPRTAPTHADILDVVTPEGFRTPAPNISAFIEWLRQKSAQ